MGRARPYNGHRSWNAWNVSLWIGNDEGLYHLAIDCLGRCKTVASAARQFIRDVGSDRTPDGGRYNVTCVREALSGLRS
jgi:hypothetical protein